MSKLREILDEINTANETVRTIFAKADTENNGDVTPEQKAEVRTLNKKIEELELKATDLKEGDAMRQAAEKRKSEMAAARRLQVGGDKNENPNPSPQYREARKSLGDTVLTDEHFASWRSNMTANGRVPERAAIQSPQVAVRSLITGLSDTSAGALVNPDYKPLVNIAPFQPLTLMDLITVGETGSDAVIYAQMTGWTNNAAPVAEATATGDGSGAKPESDMTFAQKTETVKTIAHWIAVTNRALEDAGQIRTYIDNFLRFGLRQKMELLMLQGDGVGENFTGIHNTAGILTQAWTTDLITTTRKARTNLRKNGRVNPNAYLMSLEDWEKFDLLKDGENRYYWGGPSLLGQPRLWGIPVIESENEVEGECLLGDFRYAVLWQRLQAVISMTNSHSDFFIRNLVAILAEERAAFAVQYPKAFVEVDLAA